MVTGSLLALEQSPLLDDTQKKICLQVEYPNGFLLLIWAGIRTDTSFLSFIILIGRIQSSGMKRQTEISFPRC